MKAFARILLAVLLGAAPAAFACGVCVDDKVAAVYDHELVQRALAKGRVVVVCELAGPREARTLSRLARESAGRLGGVDASGVRASADLPLVSFVLDPARQSPASAVAELGRRLQSAAIKPTLVKVLQDPARR